MPVLALVMMGVAVPAAWCQCRQQTDRVLSEQAMVVTWAAAPMRAVRATGGHDAWPAVQMRGPWCVPLLD